MNQHFDKPRRINPKYSNTLASYYNHYKIWHFMIVKCSAGMGKKWDPLSDCSLRSDPLWGFTVAPVSLCVRYPILYYIIIQTRHIILRRLNLKRFTHAKLGQMCHKIVFIYLVRFSCTYKYCHLHFYGNEQYSSQHIFEILVLFEYV